MPCWCRNRKCEKFFIVWVGAATQDAKLGYQVLVMAVYALTTSIKGASGTKLHRELDITQKSLWRLAHCIRESWNQNREFFNGPIEVGETYTDGKEKNTYASNKLIAGRATVGETAAVGAKDPETSQTEVKVIADKTANLLTGFVYSTTERDVQCNSDDPSAYTPKEHPHETVRHSVKEFVNGMAHTNGIESFWMLLKRGYYGTYYRMSKWQLQRYVNEFMGRYNYRSLGTVTQMEQYATGPAEKRLTFKRLVSAKKRCIT
jgi:hypothetical protein